MTSIQKTTSVLQDLREFTRPQHESLERNLPWNVICTSLSAYSDFLLRFYGFFVTWEPVVESQLSEEVGHFWKPRRKAHLLQTDLEWLGRPASDVASCARPESRSLALDSHAACLGSLYVIEGSTLGGQVISRTLESKLGLSGANGYSYFHSYGAGVSRAWAEFKEFLSSQITTDRQNREAVAGARTTFSRLETWLAGSRG